MKKKKLTLFKLNGEIVVVEEREMLLSEIEDMKNIICFECDCEYDNINVEFEEVDDLFSDYDVTPKGLALFEQPFHIIKGVKLNIIEGSDEYLDAIRNKTLENYLTLK